MMLSDRIIREAAERYPTPLYIFNTDALLERFQYFRKHLGDEIGLTYCMKTNPFLTAASLPETQRIEVCSDGEFRVCRSLGIPPEKLLISGVLKRAEDLEEILDYCGDRGVPESAGIAEPNGNRRESGVERSPAAHKRQPIRNG